MGANLSSLFSFNGGDFKFWMINSAVYATVTAALATGVSTLCGYSLAKYRFRMRRPVFGLVVGSLMVPATALVVPIFMLESFLSFWSGIVDERDHVYLGPYGGPLRELFGGDVLDVVPLQPGETAEVTWADGRRSTATCWLDVIEATDGEVLASYASTPWAGRPAVLARPVGAGRAVYLGTRLDADTMRGVLGQALGDHPASDGAQPAGVERVVRRARAASYEFLINHSGQPVQLPLARGGRELLSGTDAARRLDLPPQGVAIVRRDA